MKYTSSEIETLFKKVLKAVENGAPLGRTLKLPDMPSRRKFYDWIRDDEDMRERYARACEIRADAIFEEIFDIADDGTNDFSSYEIAPGVEVEKVNMDHIQRSRLRVDARKWALGKMNPKKYGDKLDVTSGNKALSLPAIVGMVIKNEIPTDEPNDDDLF